MLACGGGGKPWSLRVQTIDGQKVDDWERGPTLYETMRQLGEEGWELIQAPLDTAPAGNVSFFLIFKRSKQ